MSDIHEILVPVDFSEGSKLALEWAALFRQQTGANLHALHVTQAPEFLPAAERTSEATLQSFGKLLESRANQELDRLVTDARSKGIAIARAFTQSGVPSATIVEIAKEQKYDLIVMGTQGRTGIAQVLLGSVAERVVRHAPCPVLTVRTREAGARPRIQRILAPVDYSEGSRRSLAYAAALARAFEAELAVVHVWDRPTYVSSEVTVHDGGGRRSLGELIRENAENEMKDFLASCSGPEAGGTLQFQPYRLLSGEPASTLLGELESGGFDLVVAGTHGRTGLRRFLLGSIAEKLVRYAPVPVLTVPPAPQR